METIGNSVYTEEFEHQDRGGIDEESFWKASSTFPLVAYKWEINITLYNVDFAMTNYFCHYGNCIYSCCNDRFRKSVDQSCIFLLYGSHYQFIEGSGTEVPIIDLEELLFCEDTHRDHFDVEIVDAIEEIEDDEDESDKDSEDNSMEKMKKKVRKFVPMEKKPELALEAETYLTTKIEC